MPAFFGKRQDGRVVIEGGDARHLARSLRARVGEEIEVVDPAGFLLGVRLDVVLPNRVEGAIVSEREHRPEPAAQITIAVANLPAPALELVFSRCTEAGAFAFLVFQASRSVARGARPERWHTICREAAMLAGRLRVPEVTGVAPSFGDALATAESPAVLVRGAAPLAKLTAPQDITLFVGPEGGWSDAELTLAPVTAGLGPRNLRADTAALLGLGIALAARE